MPFNLKQHSKFKHIISTIGNQCLLSVFSFQIRFSLSFSHCQVPVLPVAALCLPRKVEGRADVEENDHWRLYHSEEMQVSDRLVTALRWQVTACTVSLWRGCCLWHSLVSFATWNTLQYCFQNLSNCPEPTKRKQRLNHKTSTRLMTATSVPKKSGVSELLILRRLAFPPFFPTLFLFFSVSHHILMFESLWVALLSTMKHRDTFHRCLARFLLGIWLSKGDLFAFGEFSLVYTASDLHTKNAPCALTVGKQQPNTAGSVTGGAGCCPGILGQ